MQGIPQGSQGIPGGSNQGIPQGSQGIPGGSNQGILKCFKRFQEIPRVSELFQEIPRGSELFPGILRDLSDVKGVQGLLLDSKIDILRDSKGV